MNKCDHGCSVRTPPLGCVLAAFEQLRDDVVDAGDLVSKPGTKWLVGHGFAFRDSGYAGLTGRGLRAGREDIVAASKQCRMARPGLAYDPAGAQP